VQSALTISTLSDEFEKFTENSRAPQPLFRGAILMQTKKSVKYISEQRIFITVINVLRQDSRLDVSK